MASHYANTEIQVARVTQEHVDARRDTILRSAARLFARQGVSGATMQEIANEADLSAGAIYRYYNSKEELLRAVFEDATTRNEQIFQDIAEKATSPLNALEQIGRWVWVEQDDRDDMICQIQMALGAAQDPEDLGVDLTQTREASREMLENLIRQAQDAGEIDRSVNAHHLAVILETTTMGVQMFKLDHPSGLDTEAVFDLFVKMVSGLGPRAGEQ